MDFVAIVRHPSTGGSLTNVDDVLFSALYPRRLPSLPQFTVPNGRRQTRTRVRFEKVPSFSQYVPGPTVRLTFSVRPFQRHAQNGACRAYSTNNWHRDGSWRLREERRYFSFRDEFRRNWVKTVYNQRRQFHFRTLPKIDEPVIDIFQLTVSVGCTPFAINHEFSPIEAPDDHHFGNRYLRLPGRVRPSANNYGDFGRV